MGKPGKFLLQRFCCVGSLRTGTLVAGVGSIILSILTIIAIALTIAGIIYLQFRMIVLDSFLSELAIQIIMIVNLLMTIVLSVLLIVGTLKRNFYLMMPWVVLGGMVIIGFLVSLIVTVISLYGEGTENGNINGTTYLVVGLIIWVIFTYMWIVVFSFFYQVWQEAKRGAYTKDPFRRRY